MTVSPGTRVGPYEILSAIGAGGMGEVYRARDARLNRDVAIKVLPSDVASNEERLRRFTLEAQAAGGLNHPNILAIHDVGTHNGQPYLVSELLQGETLRARMDAGAVPVSKAVDYVRQAATGLSAAHAAGFAHRDIKPENLFLTTDGRLKILDFGLARVSSTVAEGTETRLNLNAGTAAGVVLGTVGYMSPEQVRGVPADHRSDIFSLGVVFYELVAGRRPFVGDSAVQTMNAILTMDAPELTVASGHPVPAGLERILRHCLEKNPEERFQSARDLAFQLGAATDSGDRLSGVVPAVAPTRRRVPFVLPLLLVGSAAAGIATGWLLRRPIPAGVPTLEVLTFSGSDATSAVSPDGRTIAFRSSRSVSGARSGGSPVSRIWLKQLDTGAETVRTAGPNDGGPRFSPDGASLLFIRGDQLYRAPLLGGDEFRVISGVISSDWSPDGTRVAFATAGPEKFIVATARADGSDRRELATFVEFIPISVRWSPDGVWLACSLSPRTAPASGSQIQLVPVAGGQPRLLSDPTSRALWPAGNVVNWAGSRELIYGAMSGILTFSGYHAVGHDIHTDRTRVLFSSLKPILGVELVSNGTALVDTFSWWSNLQSISVGTGQSGPVWQTRGSSIDRQPVYSPDGARVLFSSTRSRNLDLWMLSLTDGAVRRVTDDAAADWDPAFTPDGQSILWSSNRGGNLEIWMASADGSGARQVSHDGVSAENPTMTKDGRWIVYVSGHPQKRGIWRVRPDGSDAAPIATGAFVMPEVSLDGLHVAFLEAVAENKQIHVRQVEDGADTQFRIRVERNGAEDINYGRLRWMPGTGSIVFLANDSRGTAGLFVQDFAPGRDTSATRRRLVDFPADARVESFGISPDGMAAMLATFERQAELQLATGVPGLVMPRRRE